MGMKRTIGGRFVRGEGESREAWDTKPISKECGSDW